MTAKTLLIGVMWLHITAALYISDDARVEITCTGSGLSSLPQWFINGTNVADHGPAGLRDMGVAIIPESIFDAVDENNNVFQTLVINGSAAVHGITIRCSFEGEDVYSEIVFLSNLPPPEVLEVDVSQGLVQWQPPYSSSEDETIRYFLYNIRYSVEVTDTLTQATIMYNETDATSFSFQPPPDCIEYTVTVTARCDTSVGDPAVMDMSTYDIPGLVDEERISTTLHGNTLTVIVIAQYVLNCSDPTLFYILYNNQQYTMLADDEMELSINITNTNTCISIAVKASNPAGNSSLTRVGIDGCGLSSETPSPTDNSPERKSSSVIAAVVAAVGGACALLLIITVSIICLIYKWQRKNRVEHKTETVYVGNMPDEITKSKGTPPLYVPMLSSSSDKSDSSQRSSVPSSARSSTDTTTTMVDQKTPPSSPKEKKSNREPLGEEYDHVKHQEKTYAEVSVRKQKTKCVQPPDEGVIYSGIQHPKQPVYADVALQKPKCSPPAAGSAEPVLYSLVQLQEQV